MRNLAVLLLALLVIPAAAAGTYKWVDKNGNVHYSDKPVEGAEAIDLPEPTTFDAPAVQPREGTSSGEDETATAFRYASFAFISPKQDQVFWAAAGEIPVQLALEPALRPGHEIRMYFNGELTPNSPMTALGMSLSEVYRGAHTVRAVVVDAAGNEVAAAGPVTFHVKQRSQLNPQQRPAVRR